MHLFFTIISKQEIKQPLVPRLVISTERIIIIIMKPKIITGSKHEERN